MGKVKKIWGRAKVQTTAGNLPHNHIFRARKNMFFKNSRIFSSRITTPMMR